MRLAPGRAGLRLTILAYRRFMSGRGPMRWVGCSFAACESCSAYGLRASEQAPNVLVALARIRGRLRRCRELSLYRIRDRGQELLAWGSDYDDARHLDQHLRAADELPLTRWMVLDAARQLAAYRGQWTLEATLYAQRNASLSSAPDPAPRLLLRRAPRLLAHLRARLLLELALLVSLALLGALLLPSALALALALLLALQAIHTAARTHQRHTRFARQLAAARFSTSDRAVLGATPEA